MVSVAERFADEQIAQVREEHSPSGRHATRVVPFPDWVPPGVIAEARAIEERDALAQLGAWAKRGVATPVADR